MVVLIRPEDMSLATSTQRPDGQDVLAGVVKDVSYHGDIFKLDVAVGRETVKVKVAREHGAGMAPGREVLLTWRSSAVRVLPVAERTGDEADGDGR